MAKKGTQPKGSSGKRPSASSKQSSTAANTPTFTYLDTKVGKQDCAKDKAAIEKNCKPESENDKAKRQKDAKGFLSRLKLPSHLGKSSKTDSQWINDHCEFLMIKPSSPEEMFKQIQEMPAQLADELGLKALETAKSKAVEKLEAAVKKKLLKLGMKQAATRIGSFLGTPAVGIAVNVAMTADGAADIKKAAEEFPDLKREVDDAVRKAAEAQKKISEMKAGLDKYKNPKSASGINEQHLVSDMMYGCAELNPCIRARRCSLVPYNQTENPAASRGKGCCPGQSGHHVLPSSMFKDCPTYKEGQAPTICVEGTNNSHGSHGTIHNKLGNELGKIIYINGKPIPPGSTITKEDAIDAGAKSVQEAFPLSSCDSRCIKSQLRSFYSRLNCPAKNSSGLPGNKEGSEVGTDR